MRIDPFNKLTQIYQANKPKKANATEKKSFSDSLELSRAGKDLQVAKSAVAAASDVREDKVAQIKAQMEAGTYNVTARDIAEKLTARL